MGKQVKGNAFKHGESRKAGVRPASPEYTAWNQMKARCYWTNGPYYHNYGGRGIKVCDRWFYDFRAFLADYGQETVSRIDVGKAGWT